MSDNIFDVADRFRNELLRRERQAATELVRAYGAIWQRLKRRLDELGLQIEEARALGEEPGPSWLFQYDRLESLLWQVRAELRDFARFADVKIITEQSWATELGQSHAEELIRRQLGKPPPGVDVVLDRLPIEAIRDLVGFLQNGSPLRSLLDELGPQAAEALKKELITGLGTGQHPSVIVRNIKLELAGNLVRALTIARTEVMRAYRESSRRFYQQNDDIVKGWVWHAKLTATTCVVCWAMHGSFHPVGRRMEEHPRGRCAMIPVTKTWRELGFSGVPERRLEIMSGSELFKELPDSAQEKILGPAAFLAYKAGAFELQDLVGRHVDRQWGAVRYRRSLREVLGEEEAAKWVAMARVARE